MTTPAKASTPSPKASTSGSKASTPAKKTSSARPRQAAAKPAPAAAPTSTPGTDPSPDTPFAQPRLVDVVKHPSNPRHRAVADPDMVASVRAQGLLQAITVAPHPHEAGKWILIAGHRRIDAAKKAKLQTVPAFVRWDLSTDATQLEAMLVENLHRADLTPIEEAEGYHQLTLMGHTQKAIAEKVGRDVKTVRSRLKLLKLQPSTRKKVHAGQLRLEDAAAVTEFADDPAATKRLERAASGDGFNLRQQIQRERRRAKAEREVAEQEAELLAAGARQHELGEYEHIWSMKSARRLTATFSVEWSDHDGCLGYVKTAADEWTDPAVTPVCLDVAKHDAEAAEQDRVEEEARDAARRAQEDATAADDAAADVRLQTLLDLVGTDTHLPDAVADLVRVLLPTRVADLYGTALTRYQDAMEIASADRWTFINGYNEAALARTGSSNQMLMKLRQHLDGMATCTRGTLTRALIVALTVPADENLTRASDHRVGEAKRYLELLVEAGHPFSDVDQRLRSSVDEAWDKRGNKPLAEVLGGALGQDGEAAS
ncbi:ParB/RepB/Spo0J family partition protein [Nocardioides marmoraquaticus]